MPSNDKRPRATATSSAHIYISNGGYASYQDPRAVSMEDRKERFAALVRFASQHNAWITSLPGHRVVTVETLPGSALPDELRALGYRLHEEGEGQRIVPHAITERFARGDDGSFVAATAGSTRPVVHQVTHAGLCRVLRFSFTI
jgi:hypothetical protein